MSRVPARWASPDTTVGRRRLRARLGQRARRASAFPGRSPQPRTATTAARGARGSRPRSPGPSRRPGRSGRRRAPRRRRRASGRRPASASRHLGRPAERVPLALDDQRAHPGAEPAPPRGTSPAGRAGAGGRRAPRHRRHRGRPPSGRPRAPPRCARRRPAGRLPGSRACACGTAASHADVELRGRPGDLPSGDDPRLVEPHHRDARCAAARARAPAGRRVSAPRPAPCPTTSRQRGRPARPVQPEPGVAERGPDELRDGRCGPRPPVRRARHRAHPRPGGCLGGQRVDQLGAVVPHVVDERRDRPGLERAGGRRDQQRRPPRRCRRWPGRATPPSAPAGP